MHEHSGTWGDTDSNSMHLKIYLIILNTKCRIVETGPPCAPENFACRNKSGMKTVCVVRLGPGGGQRGIPNLAK